MTIFMNLKKFIKRKIKYLIYLLVVFSATFLAQSCANALTINSNLRTISDTYLKYLENVGINSDYKNYIITSNYTSSGSYNYTIYYLCLTNGDLNISSSISLNAQCEELITYYILNNSYNYNVSRNQSLILNNTIYYLKNNDNSLIKYLLYSILIILSIILMVIVFFRLYRVRCFK